MEGPETVPPGRKMPLGGQKAGADRVLAQILDGEIGGDLRKRLFEKPREGRHIHLQSHVFPFPARPDAI